MPRNVTLVCGPPCAGKNFYVERHAQPGDVVVCLDQLAQELGSTVEHNHDGVFYGRARRHYNDLCAQIGAAPHVTAWVIRCAPDPAARLKLAMNIGATRTLVLLPGRDVAYRRAAERDAALGATCRAVTAWYRRYRPCSVDEVVHSI